MKARGSPPCGAGVKDTRQAARGGVSALRCVLRAAWSAHRVTHAGVVGVLGKVARLGRECRSPWRAGEHRTSRPRARRSRIGLCGCARDAARRKICTVQGFGRSQSPHGTWVAQIIGANPRRSPGASARRPRTHTRHARRDHLGARKRRPRVRKRASRGGSPTRCGDLSECRKSRDMDREGARVRDHSGRRLCHRSIHGLSIARRDGRAHRALK